MKWGVRKKRDKHNDDYTDRQRKNDRALYGKRSERRINRKLNEGYGLRGARHFEVERKDRKEKRRKAVRRIERAATSLGVAYVTDRVFYGGQGTRLVTNLAKHTISAGARFARSVRQAYWDAHPIYEAVSSL